MRFSQNEQLFQDSRILLCKTFDLNKTTVTADIKVASQKNVIETSSTSNKYVCIQKKSNYIRPILLMEEPTARKNNHIYISSMSTECDKFENN